MSAKAQANVFRIIGGSWRGRRLGFAAESQVRPTPDRVRETLFNWLIPWISGAHCLDLFAGSGSLGLESLSRGAQSVDFVDLNARVCEQIRQHLERLDATTRASVSCRQATDFLNTPKSLAYDIVYLDPPFGQDHLPRICETLESANVLNNSALIYLESEPGLDFQYLPDTWELTKSKRASKVEYHLVQRRKHRS